MIQEIFPAEFDNLYLPGVTAADDDYIMCIRRGDVLAKIEDNRLVFPTLKEIKAAGYGEMELIFLFTIKADKDYRFFLGNDIDLEGYDYTNSWTIRDNSIVNKPFRYASLVASQLGRWYKSHQYCGRCGHKLVHAENERMMRCPDCGVMEFPKICPCVIVGVINGDKILVSRYPNSKLKTYALIAGFAEVGETIEECVVREVFEETNIRVKNLKYYKSQPWALSESLLFGFYCELDGSEEIILKDGELAMAKWAGIDELTEENTDFALTNEMICKFKNDIKQYGKLNL